MSQAEKQAIEKGLRSIEAGKVKTHQQVIEIIRKKYPYQFK